MDLRVTSIIMIFVFMVSFVAVYMILRLKQMLDDRAFVFGIFAAFVVQMMSGFIVLDSSKLSLFINGLFLTLVFYNIFVLFGLRSTRVAIDENSFYSYYSGMGIVGNFLSFFFLGVSGFMVDVYSNNPEYVEMMGEDVMKILIDTMNVALGQELWILVVSVITAIVVSYFTLRMFVIGFTRKVMRTNFKGMLVLFAYYIVSLFVTANTQELYLQAGLYAGVALASYLVYLQSKDDRPSITIVVK
ncbi:MAG: hypothetical protein E7191_02285 [Erysipelotrichaceae bacterium]|nr:hypothetical protein [Erysipelotrichaceae bacterium]MBQ9987428.1 hypothetical protein [Erysipelotrichales bacterium]MBR3693403.1 hypothetical protein [Erysipelotrichales bacterium]